MSRCPTEYFSIFSRLLISEIFELRRILVHEFSTGVKEQNIRDRNMKALYVHVVNTPIYDVYNTTGRIVCVVVHRTWTYNP